MRVVVTRAKEEAAAMAELLLAEGFKPILVPAITIKPAADKTAFSKTIASLERYDWIIFTSTNGVIQFISELKEMEKQIAPQTRIAAVGTKTSAKLKYLGYKADFIPENYLGENILAGLGDIRNKRVLIPTANLAGPALPNAIQAAGALVDVLIVYKTLPTEVPPDAISDLSHGVDAITFTSGSTVRYFFNQLEAAGLNPLKLPGNPVIACIGPKTADSARKIGFNVDVIASPFTVEGLVSSLAKYRKEAAHENTTYSQ